MASARRMSYGTSVSANVIEMASLYTHDKMRMWSSHHRPCFLLTLAYILNPKKPPQKKVTNHATPTMTGPLSGTPILSKSTALQECEDAAHVLVQEAA